MENLNKIKNKVEEMKAKYSLEREQEDNPNHSDGFGMYWSGFFTCLKEISFFLDNLQQEKPEVDLERPIPNDLEEAAWKLYPYEEGYDVDLPYPSTYDENEEQRKAFITGAKWQKEQMMKEAVEKTVGQLERQWGGNIHFMHGFEVDEMDFPFLNSQECGYGDKVRIIIVKED